METDTGRKLASVRRIAAIDPIEGADKIECVTVDGWKLVSGKDNGFRVGDLVIYFEIDSFLPVREEFEWLRKSSFRTVPGLGEGFRIKTIKLRGQVSQGLIVPLTDFLQQQFDTGQWFFEEVGVGATYVDEGSDLTDFLSVKKYEKPIPANMQGRTKGNFPSFIRKTDQERIQNCWGGVRKWIFYEKPIVNEITEQFMIGALESGQYEVLISNGAFFKSGDKWFSKTESMNNPYMIQERSRFEVTLKLDGSSLTVYHNDGQIGVCSRNLELKRDPENPFWKATLQTGILAYLAQTGENIALQFELMGPGVQGNREKLEDFHIFLFDIFDIDAQEYWTPKKRIAWFDNVFNTSRHIIDRFAISHAPILNPCLEFGGKEDVQFFLDMADKQSSFNHDIAEGVVFKSLVQDGPSFKAISNKFLLKESD